MFLRLALAAAAPFFQINGKVVRSLDDVLAVATTIHDREYVRLTMQDVFSGVSQVRGWPQQRHQ